MFLAGGAVPSGVSSSPRFGNKVEILYTSGTVGGFEEDKEAGESLHFLYTPGK